MPRLKQQSSTRKAVENLREHLEEIPQNMRIFSLCFRVLYTDQAVTGKSEAAVKFRKIRDDTRQDAMGYLECILPVTTNLIRSVKEYFKYYEALPYEEWCEMLPDILEETRTHGDLAQTVVDIHNNIIIPLEKRHDKAKMVLTEFANLQSVHHPSEGSQRGKMAMSIASERQCEINKNAARTVAETLIPALSRFFDGLTEVANLFTMIGNKLKSFDDRSKGDMDERKQSHYKVIRNSAREIRSLCAAFYTVLPDVRTDFEALPRQDTDQNYVDKWLEKTLPDNTSQTTLKALLETSSVIELQELVDTGRHSNRTKTPENSRSTSLVGDKPVPQPKEKRPSIPADDQVPAWKNPQSPTSKSKLVPQPKEKRPSIPADDQVPALKNTQSPTSKNNPELSPRDRPASTPVDDQVPALKNTQSTTSKSKPDLPPRDRPASTPADDQVPASKNTQSPKSEIKPKVPPRDRRSSTPADDQLPTSKNKPVPTPRNGPPSTPVDDPLSTPRNKQAPPLVNKPVSITKEKAPSLPKKERESAPVDDHVPPLKNEQAVPPKSKPPSTPLDNTVPTLRNGQAPTSKNRPEIASEKSYTS